ncbi:MAG: AI-2E family transporter [Balneolaceae bacterium]
MFNNLTLEKIVRLVVGFLLVVLVMILLLQFSNLLIYAAIAILLSYLLDPIINRMQSNGLNRTFSIALTLATVILILTWISTSIIPIIAAQTAGLARQLSMDNVLFIAGQIERSLIEQMEFLPEGFLRENLHIVTDDLFDVQRVQDILGDLIGLFTNLFYAIIIIPFATFFFLKDGTRIRRDLLQLVPNKYFETSLSLIDKIETRLGSYLRSVFVQSLLVTLTAWLSLSIAGLANAASVGIAIGVANTIPYFGPILGYILSIIISIIETGDFSLVIPCILAVLVVQLMDNVLFQPLIFSRMADIHPVAILFIILIGAETAGILGMLIAIPLATIIKITVNQIQWSYNNYQVFRIASAGKSSKTAGESASSTPDGPVSS